MLQDLYIHVLCICYVHRNYFVFMRCKVIRYLKMVFLDSVINMIMFLILCLTVMSLSFLVAKK